MKKFDLGLVRLATLALVAVAVAGCGGSPELGAAQPLAPEVVAETPQGQAATTRGISSPLAKRVTLTLKPGRGKEFDALMRSQGVEPGTKGMVSVTDANLSVMFMPQSFIVQTQMISEFNVGSIYLTDVTLRFSADYNLNPGPVEYKAAGHFGWGLLKGFHWYISGIRDDHEFTAINGGLIYNW